MINCAIWPRERTVLCQIRSSLGQRCAIRAYQKHCSVVKIAYCNKVSSLWKHEVWGNFLNFWLTQGIPAVSPVRMNMALPIEFFLTHIGFLEPGAGWWIKFQPRGAATLACIGLSPVVNPGAAALHTTCGVVGWGYPSSWLVAILSESDYVNKCPMYFTFDVGTLWPQIM